MGTDIAQSAEATEINLKKRFPIARRHIIRKNFRWVILFIALCAVVRFVSSSGELLEQSPFTQTSVNNPLIVLLCGASLVLILKLLHSAIQDAAVKYSINGSELLISWGLIDRKREILFVNKINDVYVKRNALDAFLGLTNLGIVVPGQRDVHIAGLSSSVAAAFQEYLVSLAGSHKRKGQ